MEENPQKHTPQEILSVESIQNLDTARMALRWALERMAKLEQEKNSLADTAAASERARTRAQEEYAAIQKTLSLRSTDSDQRELYYAKMEEFLSLQLGGKLDLASLGKRELEVSRLQELLGQKEVQLQKELAARRASLERETERLKTDLGAQLRAKTRDIEQAFELKRSALEADYLSRLANVHEKEILHKQEAAALAERQTHFQEYYSNQRAQLQTQVKNFKAEVDDQVEFRLNIAEKLVEERHTAVEAAWVQEKMLLVAELDSWRAKAQEMGPKAFELGKSLALSDERARHAQAAADRQIMLLEEQRRQAQAAQAQAQRHEQDLLRERTTFTSELARLQEEADRRNAQLAELQGRLPARLKNWEEAQADAKQLFLRCDEQETQLAELRKNLERTEVEAKTNHLRAEQREGQRLELENKLALAEDSLRQAQAQAQQSAERLDEAQKSAWAENAGAGERERALLDERNALKADLARVQEQANAQAAQLGELQARQLESQKIAQADGSSAAQREQALLDERASLRSDLARIQEEAKAQSTLVAELQARLAEREKNWEQAQTDAKAHLLQSEEQDARRIDLEKLMALTGDSLRQAQAQAQKAAELLDEREKSAQAEIAEIAQREQALLGERGALKSDVARIQEEAKAQSALVAELQSRLDEREKNWELAQSEARAHLLHSEEHEIRRLDLEKKLTLAEDALRQARAEVQQASERLAERDGTIHDLSDAAAQREKALLVERAALKSDLAKIQEEAKVQSALTAEQQIRLEEREKNWEQAQVEAQAHLLHSKEQEIRRLDLEKKLALTEAALRRAQSHGEQAVERLKERERFVDAESESAAQREKALVAEREALKSDIARIQEASTAQAALAAELQSRLSEREKNLEQVQAEAKNNLAHSEELEIQRLELAKKLALTEDSLRQAQAETLRWSELQEAGIVENASAARREQALLEERAALKSVLARNQEESKAQAALLAELQSRLPALQQNWDQAQLESKNQLLRFGEQETRRLELEKKLALTEDSLRQAQAQAQQATQRLAESQKAAQAESLQAGQREQALLHERTKNLEAALAEQAALLAEIATLRKRCEAAAAEGRENSRKAEASIEFQRRLLESEKKLAHAEDSLRDARAQAQHAAERLADIQRTAQAENAHAVQREQALLVERAAMRSDLAHVQDEARDQAAQLADLRARLDTSASQTEAAVAAARQEGRETLAARTSAHEERRLSWEEEKKVLLAEFNDWKEKLSEAQDLAAEFEKGRLLAETDSKQKEAALQLAQEQRARLENELTAARRREQESLARFLALERGLTGAEESENTMQRQVARLEQQKIAWEQERAQMREELAHHRKQSGGNMPQIQDLEQRLAMTEEALKQARAAADQQSVVVHDEVSRAAAAEEGLRQARTAAERQAAAIEKSRLGWEAERKALLIELGQWQDKFAASQAPAEHEYRARLEAELSAARQRSQQDLPRIMELEKALAAAKDAAQQAEAHAKNQQEERIRQEAELAAARDQLHRAVNSAEAVHRAKASAERRLSDVEERRQSWEAEKRALLAELGQLKDKFAESQSTAGVQQRTRLETELDATRERADLNQRRVLALEKAVANAQAAALQAESLAQAGQAERAKLAAELISARDEARKDWEAKRKALEAELDKSKEALAAAQKRAAVDAFGSAEKEKLGRELEALRASTNELGPKLSTLELAAALAEERARQAQAVADRQTSLLEETRRGSQSEAAALQSEAKQWKDRAAAHLAELLQLKEKAAVLDEGLRQMASLSQGQAARFDERNRAWERERQDLLARIESLQPKPPSA